MRNAESDTGQIPVDKNSVVQELIKGRAHIKLIENLSKTFITIIQN